MRISRACSIGIDCRLWEETGVGRYVRNLVLELQKIDEVNDYVLFVLDNDYDKVKRSIINDKWSIINCNIRWHSIEEQLKMPGVLNKENLDLIHFPYISVPFFYNKPFVVTIHDLIPYHFSTGKASALPLPIYGLKLAAYKLIVSNAARKAQKIIVPSNETKKEIIVHLKIPEEKITITYEGIDEKLSDVQYTGIPVVKPYFLYVGNFYPHKNLETLISAFSRMVSNNNRINSIKLVLVGPEDYFYKRLKERAKKLGVLGSVIFIAGVDDQKLANLYKNALAFVTPSLMEGFGLPGLEAMANGCLVLASDIPVHKEIYKDFAIYFDPYDVEDIKNKIEQVVLNDSNHFRRNVQRGFERAKEFSWKNTAEETLKIYDSSTSHSTVSSDRIGSESW